MSDNNEISFEDVPQLAMRMALLKKAEKRFYTMFSPENSPEDVRDNSTLDDNENDV